MTAKAFDTAILEDGETLAGPWRAPKQMLTAQAYDGHASIHDDAVAQKMGFKAATIEGPTHFSQFAPLCERLWGDAWFETGCLSAHYRNAVFAGEEVQAIAAKPKAGQSQTDIRMVKRDGTEVLRGSASVGREAPATALDKRLRDELKPLADPVILRDVKIGMKTRRQTCAWISIRTWASFIRSRCVRNSGPSPSRPGSTSRNGRRQANGAARSFRSRCSASFFNTARRTTAFRPRDRRSDCLPIRRFRRREL